MTAIFWFLVLALSLFVLVKAADYFTSSAETIGLALKVSPFIIGVTIVSMGTSMPELVTSLFAALKENSTEFVAANVVGSNIANILLIIGLASIFSLRRVIVIQRSLINLDLPLLAISTALVGLILWDGKVLFLESLMLLGAFAVYLAYTIKSRDIDDTEDGFKKEIKKNLAKKNLVEKDKRIKLGYKVFLVLIGSIFFVYLGAEYTIKAVTKLGEILNIATSIITITAVAVGTSLPELVVSVKAALRGKSEIALGNVIGSNIFNGLFIIGLPAFFKTLSVDNVTLQLGVPIMVIATFLLIISGISKKIYMWEGVMYLFIYVFFIAKLFNLL